MTEVFLDTGYVVALSIAGDQYHGRAVELRYWLKKENVQLITTQAVTIEIGNFMSKLRYRDAAITLLDALRSDKSVEVIPIIEILYDRAFQLYCKRPDKEWGMTDCISFIVMQDRNLTEALTADEHFQQAGFRALLEENSQEV